MPGETTLPSNAPAAAQPTTGANGSEPAPRNLVICCDGTNNEFGAQNTNVVRLLQCLIRDPTRQLIYYDPGVGTLPEPNWKMWFVKQLSRAWSLAFGAGLTRNVEEAYAYLMNVWRPGDRVFLFGYSRGAYTVRVLAGMLHALGLLDKDNDNLVTYAMRLFKGIRGSGPDDAEESKYWRVSHQFRNTFARDSGERLRRFPIHFIGAWDTVSSVGWVWEPASFRFTFHNPSVRTVRHAISIDERRAFFRQNRFDHEVSGQDFKEQWFAGVHGDVGGGYPSADNAMWKDSFAWILDEASRAGLAVDPDKRLRQLAKRPAAGAPETMHESLTAAWRLAEVFPKLSNGRLRLNLGRRRKILPGDVISKSALSRIQQGTYSPANLSEQFRRRFRDADPPTDAQPYNDEANPPPSA